jgi:hypothetical protein
MPCRVDDHEHAQRPSRAIDKANEQYEKLKAEADNVTRMLCSLMTFLENNHSGFDFTANVEGLAKWWEAHKEVDRKREAKEIKEVIEGLSLEQLTLMKKHMQNLGYKIGVSIK